MTEQYRVPLVDPETGDGWDVVVEAMDAREAMQNASEQATGQPHVASTFIRKHGLVPDVDGDEE